MNSTDIKQQLELKKKGEKIVFLDCPICRKFFGTTEPTQLTCSPTCNLKLVQKKEQLEMYKNALLAFKANKNNSGMENSKSQHKFGK